jgi:hypothetical protein
MNDNLFDMPEVLSPRLEWMKKHDVRTHLQELMREEGSPWSAWLPAHDWDSECSTCYACEFEEHVGFGMTKDDAIVNLAKKNNLKLWNE